LKHVTNEKHFAKMPRAELRIRVACSSISYAARPRINLPNKRKAAPTEAARKELINEREIGSSQF
jgi:hypothetical protein